MGQDSARIRFRACLGRGGFGEVYRATLLRPGGLHADVAVKVLRQDVDPGSDAVKRLRDEGRLLGALRHPAILHVHDLAVVEGRVALITEYVAGEDLDDLIAAEPPIPIRALLSVVGDVASALDAALTGSGGGVPRGQLVHRDIKPSNIRVGRHGEVKLLDFGIARATSVLREARTANNAMMGSYLYMAPERYLGAPVEPPSDVFALGCVLYEGVCRERLFEGATLKAIYNTMTQPGRYQAYVRDRLLALRDGPREVTDLVSELLRADPAARPRPVEAARRLEELAERVGGPSLKRWARGRIWHDTATIVGTLDGRELVVHRFGADPQPPEPAHPDVRPAVPPARPLLDRGAGVPMSERRTVPAPVRRDRPTIPATPVPHPSTRAHTYQWIEQPDMPDPIPGVLGDVRGTQRPVRSREVRRRSRRAAAVAGALLALVVLAVGGTTYRAEIEGMVEERRPALREWLDGMRAGLGEPAGAGAHDALTQAWEAVETDDLDRALDSFDAVLARRPDDAEARLGRGTVLLRQGRTQDAVDDLCAAVRGGREAPAALARRELATQDLSCP